MTHFEEMLARHDAQTERLLSLQDRDARSAFCGAFIDEGCQADTRACGFALAHVAVAYLIPQSRYYHSADARDGIERAFAFMFANQRPGGCLDLSYCNFASAPDTSFTINEVISAWRLLEKDGSKEAAWLREPMRRLIEGCCEGISRGGFHTPNHRWAIAACLKHGAQICERPDFSARADIYLGEGLDIDEDGEFTERSAGNYNQVNDDQMIRLFLATGERRFLEAARSNLLMMLAYIDPDGSVFTNNSTRQDCGRKVYLDSYYILYLLSGYLLGDEALAAYGEYCWQTATTHGQTPRGVEWLALYPELESFGQRRTLDLSAMERYKRFFPKSGIGRARNGGFSCTAMSLKPNCLYFQHGENAVYLAIYGNVCEKRNFIPTSIEETERGFRLSARADSWYYLPFDGDGPATSDWWAMNNAETRKRLMDEALTTTVDVSLDDSGADVRIRAEGLSGVPIRLEWGFLPGCRLRNEHFVIDATPGGSMTVCGGRLQATHPNGDTITIGPAFARHNVQTRMGGAYPLSENHFTAFFTDYSPFERAIRVDAAPAFGLSMRPV